MTSGFSYIIRSVLNPLLHFFLIWYVLLNSFIYFIFSLSSLGFPLLLVSFAFCYAGS